MWRGFVKVDSLDPTGRRHVPREEAATSFVRGNTPLTLWRRTFVLGVAVGLLAGCLDGADEDERSTSESALTDTGILPNVSSVPTPAGYGNYCSVTDPTNGGWALLAVTGGDSCGQLAPGVGSNSIVRRAGLWSINGNNNVMVRCDGGIL
jgi:hypothetical protein